MAAAVAYRRLAARLGRALRDARRVLPRDDQHLRKMKVVLSDLGLELRPTSSPSPWAALCDGPRHVAPLTDLLVNLATRCSAPPQRLPDVWDAPLARPFMLGRVVAR